MGGINSLKIHELEFSAPSKYFNAIIDNKTPLVSLVVWLHLSKIEIKPKYQLKNFG